MLAFVKENNKQYIFKNMKRFPISFYVQSSARAGRYSTTPLVKKTKIYGHVRVAFFLKFLNAVVNSAILGGNYPQKFGDNKNCM